MLSQAELAAMADTADESMMDTCIIQTATVTADAVGGTSITWTDSTAIACGVQFTSERRQESIEVAGTRYDVDATIRVSLDVTVQPTNRVKVTKRYGQTLATAWTFEVLGVARRGPSANVLKARQIL